MGDLLMVFGIDSTATLLKNSRNTSDTRLQEANDLVRGKLCQCLRRNLDDNSAIPDGLELFCQPLGWRLSPVPHKPTFVPVLLTAEDGSRTCYCSLTVYQPFGTYHDLSSLKDFNQGDRSPLDEENEIYYQLENENSVEALLQLYEPVCLALVSNSVNINMLKHCLTSLFVAWIKGTTPLEEEVARMLTGSLSNGPSLHESSDVSQMKYSSNLPDSDTAVLDLLRVLGVRNLINLVTFLLCDVSVLCIGTNYTDLFNAQQSLITLLYPFELGHSYVPVLPHSLLDYLNLPSTYLMGIHSSCVEQLPSLDETVVVDLDSGEVQIPRNITVCSYPEDILTPLQAALNQILRPSYEHEDTLFCPQSYNSVSPKLQDKEIRAVFMGVMSLIIGNMTDYVMVLRIIPEPAFYIDKKRYQAIYSRNQPDSMFTKVSNGLSFHNLIHSRASPFRELDFFDNLLSKLISEDKLTPSHVFSKSHLKSVSEVLLSIAQHSGTKSLTVEEAMENYGVSEADIQANYGKKIFPRLNETLVSLLVQQIQSSSTTDPLANTPTLAKSQISYLTNDLAKSKMASFSSKDCEIVKSCVYLLFRNRMIEARKFVPLIGQCIYQKEVRNCLVEELVTGLHKYGIFLAYGQYDLLVRLLNTVLVYDDTAADLLPLLFTFYRELEGKTKQTIYSSVQNHVIWEDYQFWKTVLYRAVQSELCRIYSPNLVDGQNPYVDCIIDDLEMDDDTKAKPNSDVSLSRSVKKRAKISQGRIPKQSEGVRLPNMQSLTSKHCFQIMGEVFQSLESISADNKEFFIQREENAVFNQLILFAERMIMLRYPLSLSEDQEKDVITSLSQWIVKFVRAVEVDMVLENKVVTKIAQMVQHNVSFQREHIAKLKQMLNQSSQSDLVKLNRPPCLPCETIQASVRSYLLPDGRDSASSLPAEGYLFITTFRVVFIGTPCDPNFRNMIVIRDIPIAALYQIKEFASGPMSFPRQGLTLSNGVQLRSLTGQLMKVGFEGEGISKQSVVAPIVKLRYPEKLHLRADEDLEASTMVKIKRKDSESTIQSANRLSFLSKSPYCKDYSRLDLGTLTVSGCGTGKWRVSKINLDHKLCQTYPYAIVVPEKLTDGTISNIAAEFTGNRFPAAVWRNKSTGATLLRSSAILSLSVKPSKMAFSHPNFLSEGDKADAKPKEQDRKGLTKISEIESLIRGILESVWRIRGRGDTFNSLSTGFESAVQESRMSDTEDGGLLDETAGDEDKRNSEGASVSGPSLPDKIRSRMMTLGHKDHAPNSTTSAQPSPIKFNQLPTAALDWFVADLLPRAVTEWRKTELYIIVEKLKVKGIPNDLYEDCTLVPVEVPDPTAVMLSFKKFMRAMCPSAPDAMQGQCSYLSEVEQSEWLSHLSSLLEVSAAVADLIHVQGSSVLLALEKGTDVTAQISSLMQLLLDPEYRTIEGFKCLVEKEWLAFGHPFAKRGNQNMASALKADLSPIFLQFLDAVYQVHSQFPWEFEFNEFFLGTLAYHSSSQRFRTFSLDCEKDRAERGWLSYAPVFSRSPSTSSLKSGDISSFWTYVQQYTGKSTVFFNPIFSPNNSKEVLKPHSFQANLKIWPFYLEKSLSKYSPYNLELFSKSDVTLEKMGLSGMSPFEANLSKPPNRFELARNNIEMLLLKCQHLQSVLGREKSWKDIWCSCSEASLNIAANYKPAAGTMSRTKLKTDSLHRQTSLAVLLKGYMSLEMENLLNKPHNFVSEFPRKIRACKFCKHDIFSKSVYKCTNCSAYCHEYCKSMLPHNCGIKDLKNLQSGQTEVKPSVEDTYRIRKGSSTFYLENDESNQIFEGLLFKKGAMIRNWKQRWFVLDATSGELTYYNSRGDDKCLRCIYLKDIQTVENGDTQKTPILAAGEIGYFFEIVTSKRTYYLMAQDSISRTSWISHLRIALRRRKL